MAGRALAAAALAAAAAAVAAEDYVWRPSEWNGVFRKDKDLKTSSKVADCVFGHGARRCPACRPASALPGSGGAAVQASPSRASCPAASTARRWTATSASASTCSSTRPSPTPSTPVRAFPPSVPLALPRCVSHPRAAAVFGSTYSDFKLFTEDDSNFFQAPPGLDVDVGGVNPALYQFVQSARFDSWFTVGADDGESQNALS